MSQKYAVIFEQAEKNWAGYVLDLPGCMTTGKTLEETDRNIREAIQGHLQTLRELGEPVPRQRRQGDRDPARRINKIGRCPKELEAYPTGTST